MKYDFQSTFESSHWRLKLRKPKNSIFGLIFCHHGFLYITRILGHTKDQWCGKNIYYHSIQPNEGKLEASMHPWRPFVCHSRLKMSGRQICNPIPCHRHDFFRFFCHLTDKYCPLDHADSHEHQPDHYGWHSYCPNLSDRWKICIY